METVCTAGGSAALEARVVIIRSSPRDAAAGSSSMTQTAEWIPQTSTEPGHHLLHVWRTGPHIRRDCPLMVCSQANALTVAQIGGTWEEAQPVVEAWVDGQWVEALLDSGCTRTLVQQARGLPLDATLMVRCIHGDVCPYYLWWAKIWVGETASSCLSGISIMGQ